MAYDWSVRKAHMDDVKDIHALLLDCAQKGLLLPRALIFLYGHVRNFWVVEAPDGGIAACCALAPVWDDLGEICSLVVREDLRRHGLGRKVVEACMSDCEALHIRRVFSHEQAIGQCSEYLRRCFPDAQIVYTESTAESLSRLDEHSAGIVGAHLHAEGVVLSEENIADEKNNVTHFLLAVADGTPHPPTEKIFLCARLRHRAGSLLSFLKIFARYDLNLTKIESRPVRDCVGEYNFFIEFEGDFGEERVKSALTEAREHCVRFRVLGAY